MYKVLIIINNLKGGGAEKIVYTLLSALDKKLFEILLCVLNDEIDIELPKHIKILKLNITHITQLRRIKKVLKIIKGINPDLIHSNLLLADWVTGWYKFFNRKTVVITTIHGYNEEIQEKMNYRQLIHFKLQTHFYRKFNTIVTVSKDLNNYVLKKNEIPRKRSKVIFNGLENPERVPEFDINKRFSGKIVYIGSLRKIKNVDTLLLALANLPQSIPFYLKIVGTGDLLYELKRKAVELGIKEKVEFVGFRNDINDIMLDNDILVIPSLYESFSLTALQGLIIGIPVIASNGGGIKELFGNNLSKLLFNPRSYQELIDKIYMVVDDYHNILQIIKKERKQLLRFSAKKMIKEYQNLYLELLSEKK